MFIVLKSKPTSKGEEKVRISLASDHAGFAFKEKIKAYLEENKIFTMILALLARSRLTILI